MTAKSTTSSSSSGLSGALSGLIVVIGLGVCIIGSISGFFGGLATFTTWREGRCTILSKHLEYSYTTSRHRTVTVYSPSFTFTLQTTDGRSYQDTWRRKFVVNIAEQETILDQYSVGGTYQCWYDPGNPLAAVLIREIEPVNAIITFLVALGILLIGGLVLRYFIKRFIKKFQARQENAGINEPIIQESASYQLGDTFYRDGQYKETLDVFDRLLVQSPDDAAAHKRKGDTLLALHRPQEALVAYERAIELAPTDGSAYCGKANALGRLNRNEEALTAYDYALELAPDDVSIYKGRGDALLELGRSGEALAAYEEVTRYRPGQASGYYDKGLVLEKLNRNQEALAAYQRATELAHDDVSSWCALGNVYGKLGQNRAALAAYQQALAIKPDFVPAQDGQNRVLSN